MGEKMNTQTLSLEEREILGKDYSELLVIVHKYSGCLTLDEMYIFANSYGSGGLPRVKSLLSHIDSRRETQDMPLEKLLSVLPWGSMTSDFIRAKKFFSTHSNLTQKDEEYIMALDQLIDFFVGWSSKQYDEAKIDSSTIVRASVIVYLYQNAKNSGTLPFAPKNCLLILDDFNRLMRKRSEQK